MTVSIFKWYMPQNEASKILLDNNQSFTGEAVCSLSRGCVKLDAVLSVLNNNACVEYDLFVKDVPDSKDWVCYDTLTEEVDFEISDFESGMLNVLYQTVKKHGLSFKENNFAVVKSKELVKNERGIDEIDAIEL